MAGIASRNDLRTAISDWLLRTDLSNSDLDRFIDNAESTLRRDERIRELRSQTLDADAVTETLPSDFVALESLYHEGPTYFGEIEIVTPGMLGDVEADQGETGVPTHAALINGVLRFAPVPDATYTLRLTYWATIDRLSDSLQSNWLLDEHQDIYLYACLVEAAPYMKDDERLPMWERELEKRIEKFHMNRERGQYSGSLIRRAPRPIP